MDFKDYAFRFDSLLWGDAPPIFFIEVILRTVLLYLFALVLVRFSGKRGMGQLTPFEFVVLIAVGSALGDPMFYPDIPVLPCMLVLLTIITLEKVLAMIGAKSDVIETFVEGKAARVVYQGRLLCKAIKQEGLAVGEVCMLLREQGVRNLGSVEAAYMEPSGKLSVFRRSSSIPGLSLTDAIDSPDGVESNAESNKRVCGVCGNIEQISVSICPYCLNDQWREPITGN